MDGIAARRPIWRLLAPRARANAAKNPLPIMLEKPLETIPSSVSQRSPALSWRSEITV
jgi:hypothetical protein